RRKLLDKPEGSRTKAEKVQLDDINELIDDIQATKESLTDAVTHLADPKLSDREKQRSEAQKVDAEAQLAFWQKKVELRKLSIRDLDIRVTGLGNVLTDENAIDRALNNAEGITVSGKGPGGQITSGITAEGAWMRLSTGNDTVKGSGAVVTAGGRV